MENTINLNIKKQETVVDPKKKRGKYECLGFGTFKFRKD